jgi:hypothetical protein
MKAHASVAFGEYADRSPRKRARIRVIFRLRRVGGLYSFMIPGKNG